MHWQARWSRKRDDLRVCGKIVRRLRNPPAARLPIDIVLHQRSKLLSKLLVVPSAHKPPLLDARNTGRLRARSENVCEGDLRPILCPRQVSGPSLAGSKPRALLQYGVSSFRSADPLALPTDPGSTLRRTPLSRDACRERCSRPLGGSAAPPSRSRNHTCPRGAPACTAPYERIGSSRSGRRHRGTPTNAFRTDSEHGG